jgi:hypothetical protein
MLLCENAAAQCACSQYILQSIVMFHQSQILCSADAIAVRCEGKKARRSDETDLGKAKGRMLAILGLQPMTRISF